MSQEVTGRRQDTIYCDPCCLDDQNIEAEGYCQDCNHFLCAECCACHRKPIPSRDHIVTKEIASVNQGARKTGSSFCSETCDKHSPEVIRFHCVTHETLGCGTCMMLSHKSCKTVYIPDITKSPEFENERGKLITELGILQKDFRASLDEANLDIPEANKLLFDATNEFLSFKNGILIQLDKLEREFEDKIKVIRDHDVHILENIADTCKRVGQDIQTLHENIQAGNKVWSKLYMHMMRTGANIKRWKRTLNEIQSDMGIQKYEFQPAIDPQTDGSLGKFVCFEADAESEGSDDTSGNGTLTEDHDDQPISPKMRAPDVTHTDPNTSESLAVGAHHVLQESQTSELVAKAQSDFETIEISGMVMLPDSKLVIVDQGNQTVKLIDVKRNKVVDEIKVRYMIYNLWEPYGIADLGGNQVAVTCPLRQKIQFIKVKKSLSEGSALKVNGRCYGITYSNSKQFFVVTFADPAKVELIDKTGNTLKEVLPVTHAQLLFKQPHYIALSKDGKRLYVSDIEKSTVTQINIDGDISTVFDYNPDSSFLPAGLTIDTNGHVFVCDMASDNVHCLTEGCKFIQLVSDGKRRFPTCITYNEQDDMIYLAGLGKIVTFRIQ